MCGKCICWLLLYLYRNGATIVILLPFETLHYHLNDTPILPQRPGCGINE